MKLYMSANSPYARLVRIIALETGTADRIEEVSVNPRDGASGFWQINPVARIPTLVLDDGTALVESALICRYLDDAFAGGQLHRPLVDDPRRQRLLGLATGILDKGMTARVEKGRDGGPDQRVFVEAHLGAVRRGLDALDAELSEGDGDASPDMADFAIAATVAWIDLRHPEIDALTGRQALASHVALLSDRPTMQSTEPPG